MSTKLSREIVLFFLTITITVGAVFAGQASPDNVWEQVDRTQLQQRGIDSLPLPAAYETFSLNKAALQSVLNRAPEEFTSGQAVILTLPMPDGSFQRFEIEHSLVVEPGLLDKYPELGATYRAHGIDDPTAYVRFDLLPSGFHSMILSSRGTVMVDPYMTGDSSHYISYFKRDQPRVGDWTCYFQEDADGMDSLLKPNEFDARGFLRGGDIPDVMSGSQLRTYRLALAGNNEYCVAVGQNTVAGSLAAQVLIMNRVNGVYERDVALHMNIIANNNLIVYAGDNMTCPVPGGNQSCNSSNDPYSNGTNALNENTPNLNTVIGSANYDIGHVFTTGSGGVAQLSVPCGSQKGAGTTGLPNPIGDPFAIDYVAHEMGHQWGGLHTFNGVTSNCGGGNRSGSAAYEPGSGITVMAYAGICGAENLSNHSIDTFHVKSLEQIVSYSQNGNGNTCAVTTTSGNTPPTITVVGGPTFNIPKTTPFILTATATDPDSGDTLTYDWEEYDLGPQSPPQGDGDGQPRPMFRPYLPLTTGSRTYPSLQFILNNANIPPPTTGGFLTGEGLPSITRTMRFQVVARDNHPGTGGINTADAFLSVDANSGPFAVTFPNGGETLPGGNASTVTWDVANTSNPPVNAASVKISMSTDGGNTFPILLNPATPNDGSELVVIPVGLTSTARIKVEAVGNIFFDISNGNFNVGVGGTPSPTVSPSPFTPTPTPTPTVSPSPCLPNYTIASSSGVAIVPGTTDTGNHIDDGITPISLPFTYNLYGTAFTTANLSSNGNLQFVSSNNDYDNSCLPIGSFNMPIMAFWDDLRTDSGSGCSGYPGGTCGIYTSVSGTAPNRIFNIEWRTVPFDFPTTQANFEIRLYEGQNRFDLVYGQTDGGISATVGVQRGLGTQFTQFECEAGGLPIGQQLAFTQPACATPSPSPTTTPTPTPSPSPSPGHPQHFLDFDGDARTDFAVTRSGNGLKTWYVALSGSSSFIGSQWGIATDKEVPADYDGDGRTDVAVFRDSADPDRAFFYIFRSSNGTVQTEQFGRSGDSPKIVGDWDGDGRADVAVFRNGVTAPCGAGHPVFFWRPSGSPGTDFVYQCWGIDADAPYVGDFDGDGRMDLGIIRRPGGQNTIYIRRSSDGIFEGIPWGNLGDTYMPCDYDGDGKSDICLVRVVGSDAQFYVLTRTGGGTGASPIIFNNVMPQTADQLTFGDYDGDGRTDFGLLHTTGGNTTFIYRRSTNGAYSYFPWGLAGDHSVAETFAGGSGG